MKCSVYRDDTRHHNRILLNLAHVLKNKATLKVHFYLKSPSTFFQLIYSYDFALQLRVNGKREARPSKFGFCYFSMLISKVTLLSSRARKYKNGPHKIF